MAKDIKSGSLAKGKIFYEGMQAALRDATIDENDEVHSIEVCEHKHTLMDCKFYLSC